MMVVILISALLFYSVKGLFIFNPAHFQDFFQKGTGNLALGVALLTFTYLGSNGIIELGGEIQNPGKTIPRSLFIAFPLITSIYLLVSLSTTGAVPWANLIDKAEPLITTGRVCLGPKGVLFFVLGGAMLAVTTTLNALFIVGTKSLLMIVDDGILPSFLGKVNERFGTAHVLLTLIWGLSVIGVLTGFSLETFATYAALGGILIFFPVLLSSLYLPKRYPLEYERSAFKLKGFWLWFCPITGFVMVLFFGAVLLIDLKSLHKILFFVVFILSGVSLYLLRKGQLLKRGIDLDDLRKQGQWSV
jgi:APA family basic amino acid/polyamine antiporter